LVGLTSCLSSHIKRHTGNPTRNQKPEQIQYDNFAYQFCIFLSSISANVFAH
jgi:hypothetical protein